MVDVDETVELIIPGVGDGVGVGVGEAVGVGVGVGDGDCACADDTTPIASTKTTATNRANPRPALTLRVRETRDEQRMNSIPERAPARNAQKPTRRGPICAQLAGSVNRLGSLGALVKD